MELLAKTWSYFDAKGLREALNEAKVPALHKGALKVKRRAKKSMKRGRRLDAASLQNPGGNPGAKALAVAKTAIQSATVANLGLSLPPALKPFAGMGTSRIYYEAKVAGIPPAVVTAALKNAKRQARKERREPSRPGTPPNVITGRLKKEIRAYANRRDGTATVDFGDAFYGRVHEFGGRRHPKRPILMPALMKEAPRLNEDFANMRLGRTKAGRRMNARKTEAAAKAGK